MFGNIICPGLTASTSLTPPWLHSQLKNIYGSSLLGLWIGEDIVVDGSNNVTSWPGRVGGTLTHSNTDYATAIKNVKKGMTFSIINKNSLYSVDLGVVCKSFWAVAQSPPLPSTSFQVLCKSRLDGDDPILLDSGVSTLFTTTGWSHYVDSVLTETLTPGVHVIEGIKASPNAAATNCMKGYSANYQWSATDYFRMALSAIPTQLQRLQTQFVLDSYYRPSQAPAAKLALDLYRLLGDTILGLWVGEDITLLGSNLATWPGRFGPTLTPTGTYLTQLVGGRRYARADNATDVHRITGTFSAAPLSFISVASVPALIGDGSSLIGQPAGAFLSNNTPGLWYTTTSWAHYRNGVADETCVAATPAVFEASIASQVDVGLEFGGRAAIVARSWTTDFGFLLALSAVLSSDQRYLVNQILRSYYNISLSPQELLAGELSRILNSSMIGLWMGEDAIVSGSSITSWPSRVGPTLANTGTGFWGQSTLNSRRAIIGSSSSQGCLYSAMSAPQTLIAVAQTPSLPFSTYEIIARTSQLSNTNGFCGNNGSSVWFEPDPPYTTTRYLDGIANTSITPGTHVWEAYAAGDTTAGLAVGYAFSTNNFSWQAPVGCVLAMTGSISLDQRAQVTQVLRSYYGF